MDSSDFKMGLRTQGMVALYYLYSSKNKQKTILILLLCLENHGINI